MTKTRTCPECGVDLPPEAASGLCPKCLMKKGFETQDDIGTNILSNPAEGADDYSPLRGFTPPEPEELAEHFPQLEIIELIGKGGMGAVYKARQPQLDRLVALKILPQQIGIDPHFSERFTREARALAKLNHPNIVAVYDFGTTDDGLFYFVMEFVDGLNLRQVIQGKELTPVNALAIVPQVCEALQFAHDEGIIHRDIKPENLLMDKKGRVKIADFGLAKLLGQKKDDFTLTGTGQVMGTPHYMAPEQFDDPLTVDHRSDIYSLGVVLYEMLTGELPIGRFAPPSQKVQIDVRLDEVVLKTLENQPDLRYQHASDVKTEVETITRGPQAPSSDFVERKERSPQPSPGLWKRLLSVGCLLIVGLSSGSLLFRSRNAFFDFSPVVWAGASFVLSGFFIWNALRKKKTTKAWSAALILLCGLGFILIYLFMKPQPSLDWLYAMTGESSGTSDVTGARVLLAILLAGVGALIRTAYQKSREEMHPDVGAPHPPLTGNSQVDGMDLPMVPHRFNWKKSVGLVVTVISLAGVVYGIGNLIYVEYAPDQIRSAVGEHVRDAAKQAAALSRDKTIIGLIIFSIGLLIGLTLFVMGHRGSRRFAHDPESVASTESPPAGSGGQEITVPSTPGIGSVIRRRWLTWYAQRSVVSMRIIKAGLLVGIFVCLGLFLTPHQGKSSTVAFLYLLGFILFCQGHHEIKKAEVKPKSELESRNFKIFLGGVLMLLLLGLVIFLMTSILSP